MDTVALCGVALLEVEVVESTQLHLGLVLHVAEEEAEHSLVDHALLLERPHKRKTITLVGSQAQHAVSGVKASLISYSQKCEVFSAESVCLINANSVTNHFSL